MRECEGPPLMVTAELAGGVRFGRTVVGSTVGAAVDQGAEAVVLAATRKGVLATGVAAGLRARGAEAIERSAMAAAPLELGTALAIPASGLERLGAMAIVYAVVHPALGEAARIADVRRAVVAVLAAVDAGRWRSLALPLLGLDGAGVARPPVDAVVDALVDELVGCLRRGSSRPDRIVLVARSAEHAALADRALERARRLAWTLGR